MLPDVAGCFKENPFFLRSDGHWNISHFRTVDQNLMCNKVCSQAKASANVTWVCHFASSSYCTWPPLGGPSGPTARYIADTTSMAIVSCIISGVVANSCWSREGSKGNRMVWRCFWMHRHRLHRLRFLSIGLTRDVVPELCKKKLI